MAEYTNLTTVEVDISANYNPKSSIGIPGFIKGPAGDDGDNGVTFTPTVSEEGIISWTNDGGRPNPDPVNIKGPAGSGGFSPSDLGTGLKMVNGKVEVDTANEMEQNNVLPITSGAVYREVGNINALLATI